MSAKNKSDTRLISVRLNVDTLNRLTNRAKDDDVYMTFLIQRSVDLFLDKPDEDHISKQVNDLAKQIIENQKWVDSSLVGLRNSILSDLKGLVEALVKTQIGSSTSTKSNVMPPK